MKSIANVEFSNLAAGYLILTMQTVAETRRNRLAMLVKKHGDSLAQLNEALGLDRTDATLSQIRTQAPHSKTGKPRVMGDELARKIEEKLGLEVGWMDTPPTYAELDPDPMVANIIQVAQQLHEEGRSEELAQLMRIGNTFTQPKNGTTH